MTPIRFAFAAIAALAPAVITPSTGVSDSDLRVGNATADAVLQATANILRPLFDKNDEHF
jgi:hypothetical protein